MSREDIEKAWNMQTSPTFTGLIPETFRKRPGTVRSDNPTHSVTAMGRYAEAITKDHKNAYGGEKTRARPKWASNGAFGKNSPWDKMYRLDTKYMFIGIDMRFCTMLHHVEVILLEDHLWKIYRSTPWPDFDFGQLGRKLEDLGLVRVGKIGEADTRLISSRILVDSAIRLLGFSAAPCRQEGPERLASR
jgi:aminoglycoside 3-N-acetyltransferase